MTNYVMFAILLGVSSAKLVPIINSQATGALSSSNVWGVDVVNVAIKEGDVPLEPSQDQRCAGRNYGARRCCTPENPCDEGEGDCDGFGDGGAHDGNSGCKGSLVCGSNNCKKFGIYYHEKDDCCEKPKEDFFEEFVERIEIIPAVPSQGQRCSGRNYQGRRCCTPENPCNEGEGDCDGPSDGGAHDGNAGCKTGLVCGSNNCKKFGTYYHEKDDCCEKPSAFVPEAPVPQISGVPSIPPHGQRCSGRNYQGRRCCTPENPCNEGEGDCDGPSDGGAHDGNAGCKTGLVCGSNNCKKFGTYYHEKDDCCEKPFSQSQVIVRDDGWGPWESWTECTRACGGGKKNRNRYCSGPSCKHTTQSQERPCNTRSCRL